MSLIDRVKNILKEAPDRTPDSPSGLDFEGQSKKFVKNERDKKKTMRKLEPKGSKQGELNLGNTNTTNTPLSTKRTLKGRPLGSKTKSKGETYKQLTTGGERQKQRKTIKKEFKKQQPISDLKKAKKYAAGEYPKIGGGGLKPDIKKPIKGTTPVKTNVSKVNVDKIFSGAGNVKKGGNVPDKNISSKSKGITPVKTNISKVNVDKIFDKPKNPITKTIGVKQSDVSKTQKKFTQKINKANKNRKEFEYAKSKEIKKFRGTVTQGADKGRGYTIERNPSPKGSRKGIPINKPRNAPIERSNRAIGDLFRRYGRGEPKATQFVIDLTKDNRKARGLGKRAERVTGASGGKKTGSLRKGNLSFPGDRTGAYSTTKTQIDFDKALRRARGNTEGDLPPEAPKSVKDYAKGVRDKRIKKYKLPDTSFDSKTKFSQKQFDKGIGGAKKPTTAAAPGLFGKPKNIKPIKPKVTQPTGNAKREAIANLRASEKRLYDAGVGKKPSLVQQRKASKKIVAAFNAAKAREMRAYADLTPDGDTGAPSKEIKYKRVQKLPGQEGPRTGVPQKGGALAKVKNVAKPVTGTYRGVGTGQKEITNVRKRVKSILNKPLVKGSDSSVFDFTDKKTGRKFDMSKDSDKAEFLRQQGKNKYLKQIGLDGGGGSGGGRKPPLIGTGGPGGGGERFRRFGKKVVAKGKGFGKKVAAKGKGFRKDLIKFVKNNRVGTALALGAAGYYGFQAAKRAIEGPQLDPRKDFTKTGRIKYGTGVKSDLTNKKMAANKQKVGDNVRFSYGTMGRDDKGKRIKDPDYASPTLTKTDLEKFKNKVYTVKDSKGKTIDVNKRIQNSAFTKQLQKANQGKNQKSKDFMKKYQKQAKFRGIQ